MRIAHAADLHIRNLKYHYEYREVFNQFYESLKEEKVDCIILCGDIAHTKTQISPEFVSMASDLFRNLADIAPTYVILGNHDGNLRNNSREDALTPVVEALDHPRLVLIRNSEEALVGVERALRFKVNVLSVFDRQNWSTPSDPSAVNIALYHGALAGSKTDVGWVIDRNEDSLECFEGHDFIFLGDIHKTNQILDDEGWVRYPGSLIPQNFG